MGNLGAWRPVGLGAPAPSAMTSEQGLRTRPWVCCQLSSAFSQKDQTLEGEVMPWDLPCLVRTEDNTCSRFIRTCYLTMTWPPERGIWHQDFSNHSSCPSLLSPWKGFCWEFEMFYCTSHPSPCMVLSKRFSALNAAILVLFCLTVYMYTGQ